MYPKFMDYYASIAEGLSGATAINIMARNTDITGTASQIDNGLNTTTAQYISSITNLQIASQAAADATAGANARVITIYGLNENYSEASENVTLNGTTEVFTTGLFSRVFYAEIASFGTNKVAAGNIWIFNSGGTHTAGVPTTTSERYLKIPLGEIDARRCTYTIPAGKKGFVKIVNGSTNHDNMLFELYKREYGESVFRRISFVNVYLNYGSLEYHLPLSLNEKTDIELRATHKSTGAADVSGYIQMYTKS